MFEEQLYNFLREVEGEVLTPYHDHIGYPTIGVGHLLSRVKWEDLSKYNSITKEESQQLLLNDLQSRYKSLSRLVQVPLTDTQRIALISFVFNLGAGALQSSTLRRKLNTGDYEGAANEFPRWIFAGGKKSRGLLIRRLKEQALFQM